MDVPTILALHHVLLKKQGAFHGFPVVLKHRIARPVVWSEIPTLMISFAVGASACRRGYTAHRSSHGKNGTLRGEWRRWRKARCTQPT
jgi:hypothetical protein